MNAQTKVNRDDKSTCSSEPNNAQPLRNSTNSNLQADVPESDINVFQNDTSHLETDEKPRENKYENALKAVTKKKQNKVATSVLGKKRKSETLKPDVRSDEEELNVEESNADQGEWVTVEPKKKRRKKNKRGWYHTMPEM